MKAKRYGRIVLTSSSAGAFGRTSGTNYCAAKAGLLGLGPALALLLFSPQLFAFAFGDSWRPAGELAQRKGIAVAELLLRPGLSQIIAQGALHDVYHILHTPHSVKSPAERPNPRQSRKRFKK